MIIFNFIKYLILYIKYNKILKKAYYDEKLIQSLNVALNTEFRVDWVGRLYTVLNPLVQKIPTDPADGSSSIIYNMTLDGTWSDKIYIEKWIMDRMNFMNSFIQMNALWDLLVYRIEELENKNFLVIFEPILWEDLKKWTKKFLWLLLFVIVILVTLLIIF